MKDVFNLHLYKVFPSHVAFSAVAIAKHMTMDTAREGRTSAGGPPSAKTEPEITPRTPARHRTLHHLYTLASVNLAGLQSYANYAFRLAPAAFFLLPAPQEFLTKSEISENS